MPQELLPYLMGLLQWARARQQFSDWWYAGIVIVASFAFYVMGTPDAFAHPIGDIFKAWGQQALIILGMTQGISTGANLVASLRQPGTAVPPALPVTNSQP